MKSKLNKFFIINTATLLLLFILSIIVRIDNLKAPAGKHHEWLTGHVLTTMSIFEKNGIADYYFSPVLTFDTKAEHEMLNNIPFKDKNKNIYYTSYPPFCFIFPYMVLKMFNLKVSLLGLRIINLLIHFVCAVLIFLIINRFYKKSINEPIFIPSLIGYIMYLFSNGNLWFHGNIYFADMLVHIFILTALYVFICVTENPVSSQKLKITLLGIFTFLGVYTEWIALFFAFYMGIMLFLKGIRNKLFFRYVAVLFVSSVFAIGLSIFQYTRIAGFELLKNKTIEKYSMRSGHDEAHSEAGFYYGSITSKVAFFKNYETNYSSLLDYVWLMLYVIIFLVVFNIIQKRNSILSSHFIAFGVVFLSIVTHHFVFFNFTVVHDFSTLKSTILFTLFIGYVLGMFFIYTGESVKRINSIAFLLLTGWFVYSSVQDYKIVNFDDKSACYQKVVGDYVHEYSKPDEVVFTNTNTSPVMSWYAQRGLLQVNSFNDCINFLKYSNYPKGIYVELFEKNKTFIVSVKKINNNDSILVKSELIPFAKL